MLTGIISAMQIEAEGLKTLMANVKSEIISGIEFISGTLNEKAIVVAVAGVGKVNAAVCAEAMILKYAPDAIINIGVAGGLDKGFKVGDIAVADSVVEHDMDTSPLGDEKGFITGINTVYMKCDSEIAALMEKAALSLGTVSVKRGVIASGDQFIASGEQRLRIISDFGAIAAEMEGASIGHVCTMNGIRFGVLRAISDGANDNSPMDFPTFTKMAAENSIKIIVKMLEMM